MLSRAIIRFPQSYEQSAVKPDAERTRHAALNLTLSEARPDAIHPRPYPGNKV
jgi:hypothetical protein